MQYYEREKNKKEKEQKPSEYDIKIRVPKGIKISSKQPTVGTV